MLAIVCVCVHVVMSLLIKSEDHSMCGLAVTSQGNPAENMSDSSHFHRQVQCCFTSTETIRTIRDGEPRTATSTFTQLLSSEYLSSKLNVASRPQRP